MKKIYFPVFYSIVIILLFCSFTKFNMIIQDNKQDLTHNRVHSGLKLEAIYKGSYESYEESDSNSPTFILMTINFINDTDSTIRLLTGGASPDINIVFDKKGYSQLFVYSHPHPGGLGFVEIESGQIYSFPIIIYPNDKFDVKADIPVKIGFILFTWEMSFKDTRHPLNLFQIFRENHEHVIWSNPVDCSVFPFRNHELLRIVNDTTFSYSKH